MSVEGRIEADAVDATALIATAIGMPAVGQCLVRGAVRARCVRRSYRPGRAHRQAARDHARDRSTANACRPAVRRIGDRDRGRGRRIWAAAVSSRSFSWATPAVGSRRADACEVRAADATAVIAGEPRPVLGRTTLRIEIEGTGLSPAAFIGSLEGKGTIVLEGAQIAGLDAKAFETVIKAVDRGLAVDAGKDTRPRAHGARRRPPQPAAGGRHDHHRERARAHQLGGAGGARGSSDLWRSRSRRRRSRSAGGVDGPLKPPTVQRPAVFVLLRGTAATPRRDRSMSPRW